jgi:hypothetical protein
MYSLRFRVIFTGFIWIFLISAIALIWKLLLVTLNS